MSQTIHVTQTGGKSGPTALQKKRIKWVIAAALIAAISGGWSYRSWKQAASAAPTYKELTVRKGALDLTILSTGVVQPENRVEIKPPIAGRVEKVLVNEGDYVRKGQILAWMSSTERAALLDAASARGAEELKQWEEMYRPTPILAPINGRIILRNVESGQAFATTDAILVMSDRLTVKAQVDETDIAQIKVRQKGTIVLDAYPRDKLSAIVDQIAYDAKTVNNVTTYIVDVLPLKAPETMRSGMTANVTFEIESRKDVLVVPADAVKTDKGRSTVLVPGKSPGPQYKDAIEREIKTGISDGKKIEVLSGISEGDLVLAPEIRIPTEKPNSGASSPFAPTRPSSRGSGSGRSR